MPFNVLLLPLLGGYIFITNWNRTRFNAKRHTGERLLFEAATAGLLFLLVAFVLVHLVTAADPALHDRWAREVPFPYAGTSLLAFLLGAVAWFPANWFFRRDREARRVIQEWGDHLEVLFDRAITENRQVSVTLKSGKVYIRFVLENFDPAYDRKYITILPTASGYRSEADQELVLTTPYSNVYLRIMESERKDISISDFRVVIPVAEVMSANLFDWDAYDEFQSLAGHEAEAASPESPSPSRTLKAPPISRTTQPRPDPEAGMHSQPKSGRRRNDPSNE